MDMPKLPFNHHNPSLWFHNVEAIFTTRRIKDQPMMYAHILPQIPTEVQNELEDFFFTVHESPYDELKKRVLEHFAVSDDRRIQQLLQDEMLGDQKPSQLLARLRRHAYRFNCEESLIRALWLKKLPVTCQQLLACMPGTITLSELAASADKVMEVTRQNTSICAVASPESNTLESALMDKLVSHIDKRFAEMQPFRSRSRSRSRTSSSKTRNSTLCWYHRRFGADAKKCTSPCSFQPKQGNAKGSQ